MSKTNTTSVLLQNLRRVFKKVISEFSRLKKLEVDCQRLVESLANLLSQRQAVLKVGQDGLAWSKMEFPDLQARLLVKISAEVDVKVDLLKELILPLKDHHDHVSRARTDILRLLQKHGRELNEEVMCQGSPTVPPMEVMLGWVDNLEKELRELYYCRLHYLECILEPELLPDSLTVLWNQNADLYDILQDCEEQTRFFLEEAG
ncbi:chromosome 1 open reading frame 109 [Plakobranchus ocellatus]|uniref:Chromosome 1 open reading frame 109 n=1 Tax=Plakobranchus ocellatus TaxID=259542 RepID=A0AAV3ZD85_9GAST|nr:chromosome 1 open reading frame 109 [Plakobranchus ocellatus]